MWYKVKKIYKWVNWVEKQIYPAGWKPWANTLFYYPLVENANDTSWNNRNWTASNTTFSSSNWAYFRWWYSAWRNWTITTATFTMWTTYTINTWLKSAETLSWDKEIDIHRRWTWQARYVLFYVNASGFYCVLWNWGSNNGNTISYSTSIWTSWHNICLTRSWSNIVLYADWQQLASWDGTYSADTQYFYIGNDPSNVASYAWSSYFKDYIMENKARTASEIAEYYNQTKSNYGL